jgi:hypothetical protein
MTSIRDARAAGIHDATTAAASRTAAAAPAASAPGSCTDVKKLAASRDRFRMLVDDGCVHRRQLGACLFNRRTGGEPAEEVRYPVIAARDHRRPEMMRAGDDVRDDFRVGGIGHRRLEYTDDRGGSHAETEIKRSSSRLTSGRSSTPRTTLNTAAFAPMPRPSVTMTVAARPLARNSERTANRMSRASSVTALKALWMDMRRGPANLMPIVERSDRRNC